MSAAQRPHQPWPMKWIILAVLVVIVPYTFLRWHYRKPGRAFEPAHDIQDRANTMRLLNAGFQRITLDATRPAEAARFTAPATTFPAAGGLPEALAVTLVEKPLLPAEIVAVSAGATGNAMLAYPVELTCALPDNKQQLSGAQLYLRSEEIYIVPDFEKLGGALLARSRESLVRLTVPAGALKPGHYRVTLIGARASKTWKLEIR